MASNRQSPEPARPAATATAALADGLGGIVSLRGLAGAAAYLGTVASGGLLLGTTTGLVMRRLALVR